MVASVPPTVLFEWCVGVGVSAARPLVAKIVVTMDNFMMER